VEQARNGDRPEGATAFLDVPRRYGARRGDAEALRGMRPRAGDSPRRGLIEVPALVPARSEVRSHSANASDVRRKLLEHGRTKPRGAWAPSFGASLARHAIRSPYHGPVWSGGFDEQPLYVPGGWDGRHRGCRGAARGLPPIPLCKDTSSSRGTSGRRPAGPAITRGARAAPGRRSSATSVGQSDTTLIPHRRSPSGAYRLRPSSTGLAARGGSLLPRRRPVRGWGTRLSTLRLPSRAP